MIGIDEDPDWAEVSEYDENLDAYHWGPLLEIDLPGVVGPNEPKPSICIERFDRVTEDRQHQIVGDYAIALSFDLAGMNLTSPDDLDVFADRLREAAQEVRAFMKTEGFTEVVTDRRA
ncbi:hypothetical protein [Curtobacterium sp. PhB137]|uniref:hypothetical protein n=1 Tax=Curtobacterium sp. PhB137 TaxID=2485182 RepID=UPI000F4E6048|nr:hypothetical protein [Curtobacterium sp. PhB137]